MQCHVASHQWTDSQQVGGSVCFEETLQSWGFHPGGAFHHHVCQLTGSLVVFGCVSPANAYYACVCTHVCACMPRREKEHWGQLYLCCFVVVSWQCPSHHSMGLDIRSDRSDLHATSPSPDTQTHAYTKTTARPTQTDRSARAHAHTHTVTGPYKGSTDSDTT